ncbi:uncharacterized protein BDR25DRAFT_302134 [Lindgomyces ingoldianus]|uniref:Uncharacterized protein n=1 Tax=Lindgomyces ingoldianus TaxID=673940 RepID=A0ACB6R1H8_9PLEO|nr:uncharacterized protein BDR25DRAFT_302134 [Lindgomyces ingoldianus]KAF2473133.1 hypothetical protein BDR25DRAFT_302134 [Lindgomyces ingoldianus]
MSSARNRGSTTPMEFEWQNNTGPTDAQSPFLQAGVAKKRPHSVLDSSPSKSSFSTPNRFQLREPNSERHLFSDAPKPLPAVPSHVWEPRTPTTLVDLSSGGETPNTPANDDSEAATPETQLRSKMGGLMSERRSKSKSPTKRRESWYNRFLPSSSPSPAKEKEKEKEPRDPYSKKAEHRIMKRRSKNKKALARDDYGYGYYSDDDSRPNNGGAPMPQAQPDMASRLGSLFTFIEAHPHLPSVLSFYLQLLINSILGLFFVYIIFRGWRAVLNDIDLESRNNMIGVIADIKACAKEYTDNRCDPHHRVPAMAKLCQTWENCMQRDPQKAAAATVSAKTFAMIFNAFVEEFSYKSMIFTAIVIFGGFNISNWAFGLFRQKQQSHPGLRHSESFNYPPPPATPQRYPSNGFIDQQHFYTPYGSMNANMLPQAAQSMPALPMPESIEASAGTPAVSRKEERSPSKKSFWR